MAHEHTSYHAPIDLAERRPARGARTARATPEFTFDSFVRKHGPRIETADERVERLMANLRAAEGTATRWERLAVAALFALSATGVVAGLFQLFRL